MERLTWVMLTNFWRIPPLWHKLSKMAKYPEKYTEEEKYRYIQKIFQLEIDLGHIDLQCTGTEHLPAEGGFLLYGNHQGKFDAAAVVASCPKPLGAVMKKELEKHPFFSRVMKCTNSFALDRESARQGLTVINNVIREVKSGRNYLIFPEGEANRVSNEVGEFHHGSFRCAIKTRCPVVPVALVDCFKPMDRPGHHPVSAQVHFLAPIQPEEYAGMNTTQLAALVKARIVEAVQAHTAAETTSVA